MSEKTMNEIKEILFKNFVENVDFIRQSLIDVDHSHELEDIISAMENNEDIFEEIFVDGHPFIFKECLKKYFE